MAKRTINLDMTACDNREMRIGSITSWDGSASELVAASNYEERGKGEKKKGMSQEDNFFLRQPLFVAEKYSIKP